MSATARSAAQVDAATGHTVRVAIACQHQMVRDGLRRLIDAETDLRVVGDAADSGSIERVLRQAKPDILVLDLELDRLGSVSALREAAPASRPLRLIALALNEADPRIGQALHMGVQGIAFKTLPATTLLEGLRRVMGGGYWLGSAEVPGHRLAGPSGDDSRMTTGFKLTPRELDVVSHIVNGFSNRDIARKLSVTEDTVKHHLTSVFNKMGVSNRLELALFALHHQLCPPGPAQRQSKRKAR